MEPEVSVLKLAFCTDDSLFFGGYRPVMGNPGPNEPRRRYARPGEFEIPGSILESSSFSQHLSAELSRNSDRKANAPVAGQAGQSAEVTPKAKSHVLPPGGQRLGADPSLVRKVPPAVLAGQRIGMGLSPNPRNLTPLTRRDTISGKRVAARFELLPDRKPRWDRMGWSAAGQLVALAFLLLGPTIFPQQMHTALKFNVVDVRQPVTHININVEPTTPPPPPPKKPKVPPPEPKPILPKPKQVVVEPPELNPRQPHVFLVLKPELPKVHKVEVKPVELKQVFQTKDIVLTSKQPARPKEEVKAASLNAGTPAQATVAAPANKVQTGGFGDPNGISGAGNPNKAGNINAAGSPNLPGGPGSGNGSAGSQGIRGTVASEGSKTGASATAGVSSGVDILYEPNPAYTNEARFLKMEGDVVLEVVFLASGQMQVTRVVSGLGHGLDEAAIQAAKQIRFRPAKRDGNPIDFAARVRIEFRLSK